MCLRVELWCCHFCRLDSCSAVCCSDDAELLCCKDEVVGKEDNVSNLYKVIHREVTKAAMDDCRPQAARSEVGHCPMTSCAPD